MSYYVAKQTGVWENNATWCKAFNSSPVMAASTNISISTTPVPTVAAVAAASTGNVIGCLVEPATSWTGKTVVFQLQANGVDVPGASVTITGNDIYLPEPLFVKLLTPVAKVSGVSYRFTLTMPSSTATVAAAVQGVTTAIAALILDDTAGYPVAGDFFAIHAPNCQADIVVTVDSVNAAMGNNAAPFSVFWSANPSRTFDQGTIGGGPVYKGKLKFEPTVNTLLSWSSNILFCQGGLLEQKPDSTHTSGFLMNGTTALSCFLGFWDNSGIDLLASSRYATDWRTTVVSGSGTTGSPVVLAGKNYAVGDRLVFTSGTNSATNYLECEEKYIKTKINATTFTLSNTPGGAESGLTYSHVGAHVFNITVNVSWTANVANSWHANFNSLDTTGAAHSIKGVHVSGLTSSGSAARASMCFNGYGTWEDIFNYDNNTSGAVICYVNTLLAGTYTRLFIGNGGSGGNSQDGRIVTIGTTGNKVFNDSWVVAAAKVGWKISADNNTFNFCGAIACGQTAALPELYSGWNLSGNINTFNNCEAHATGQGGILFYLSCADNVFNNFISGTKAKNGLATIVKSATNPAYVTAYFDKLTQVETTLVSSNASMLESSNLIFKNLNNVSYANFRVTNNGQSQFTGAGLADTTVPNLGTYAVRHAPTTSVGMKFRYRQLATPGTNFVTYGRLWGNSTFVSDPNTSITVDLYLPGLVPGVDTPTRTVTMTKTTDKTSVNAAYTLSAPYAGSVAENAQIIITFKNPSATAGAYAWVGDLLNSENATTKFVDVWNGQPQDVMPLGASTDPGSVAISVWAALLASNTVSGSFGKAIADTMAYVDTVESGQATLATAVGAIATVATAIYNQTDTLESGQTTLQTDVTTIKNQTDTLEASATTIVNATDTLEASATTLVNATDTVEATQATILKYVKRIFFGQK